MHCMPMTGMSFCAQALLAQGEAAKAVPDLQKAVQLSSGDDAAAMQEVLDGARAQLPAGAADVSLSSLVLVV